MRKADLVVGKDLGLRNKTLAIDVAVLNVEDMECSLCDRQRSLFTLILYTPDVLFVIFMCPSDDQ